MTTGLLEEGGVQSSTGVTEPKDSTRDIPE